MKIYDYRIVLAFVATLFCGSAAHSLEQHFVRKHLECGSFSAEFITVVTIPFDTASKAFSQSLRLFKISGKNSFVANLGQHKSRLDSKHGWWLDAIASGAACFHSRFGKDYLIVDFNCWNTEARTCSTGMGAPDSEWTQIYDSYARPLTGGQRMTVSDQKRLDALGLEFRLWQQLPNKVALW